MTYDYGRDAQILAEIGPLLTAARKGEAFSLAAGRPTA
jgi:hypothetical protein